MFLLFQPSRAKADRRESAGGPTRPRRPCRAIGLIAALILFASVPQAEAQLFGQRNLGSPLSRRPKPGTTVGAVTGSERFIRGNRSAADFVGTDSRDTDSFVGAVQGSTSGRVRTAVENLRPRQANQAQLNPTRPARGPRQMYEPRLELGFPVTEPPLRAILANVSRSLETPDGRFDRVEVQVSNRTATLRGTVGSNADKSLAEALVRFEPGITDVRNELGVYPGLGTLPDPVPPRPER